VSVCWVPHPQKRPSHWTCRLPGVAACLSVQAPVVRIGAKEREALVGALHVALDLLKALHVLEVPVPRAVFGVVERVIVCTRNLQYVYLVSSATLRLQAERARSHLTSRLGGNILLNMHKQLSS
jgi:hypothetical protein